MWCIDMTLCILLFRIKGFDFYYWISINLFVSFSDSLYEVTSSILLVYPTNILAITSEKLTNQYRNNAYGLYFKCSAS